MLTRFHATTLALIVGVIWLVLLVVDGVAVELKWLAHLPRVVPVLLIVLWGFDRWLWRAPRVGEWLAGRPYLGGTWLVELRSDWKDPATGLQVRPITAYMAVRQTFSKLSMRLMTRESESTLVANKILKAEDGVFQIVTVYQNVPDISLRGVRSEIHFGAFVLNVQGSPPQELRGHYWTDRNTSGHMTLKERRRKVYSSYQEAAAGFARSTEGTSQP